MCHAQPWTSISGTDSVIPAGFTCMLFRIQCMKNAFRRQRCETLRLANVKGSTMLRCTLHCSSRGDEHHSQPLCNKTFTSNTTRDGSGRMRSVMQPNSSQSDVDRDAELLCEDIGRIQASTGSYPDRKPLSRVQGAVKETIGWLRHAMPDPEDFSSAAIGRMVSKEYGKHEPPHTEHHMWRTGHTPHPSPPTSPMACTQQQQGQQMRSAHATSRGTTATGGMSPAVTAIAKTVAAAALPAGPAELKDMRDIAGSDATGNTSRTLGCCGGTEASGQAAGWSELTEQRSQSGM